MSFSCEKHGDMIISIEEGSIVIKTFDNEKNLSHMPRIIQRPFSENDSNYGEIFKFIQQKSDRNDGLNSIIEFKPNCFGFNAQNTKRVQIQMNQEQFNIFQCNCPHEKQPKKEKQQKIIQPKEMKEKKKPQQSSDSKTQQKPPKNNNQVSVDIKAFEDKIKLYTTEVEENKKRTPKISTEWIKKITFQKRKK